ncbi:MAG: amidase family protein [Planctomycetota bacterium]
MSASVAGERLLELSAGRMAELVASRDLSAAELVEAHITRIESSHREINALSQRRFESARSEAVKADRKVAAGEAVGPLHGVPVTIKDCFAVAGMRTTLGIGRRGEKPDHIDSPLVARLRAAGAIVLGKTNVPQAMLLHECDNPVFGRTNLPGFPDRSPGGSTGGEAALVAAQGSPLGLGSDLGGSIRQPAASCGLFGLMPTAGWLTLEGSERAISRGMQAIPIRPGPLARTAGDLRLAMGVLGDRSATGRQRDESRPPWASRAPRPVAGLRIGYWADDGFFAPATAVANAVERAADVLREAGAELVPVQPPDIREMVRIYVGLLSADGLAAVRQAVRGGRVEPQLQRQLRLARLPRWLRAALSPTLGLLGQTDLAELLAWSGPRSAEGYWQLVAEADAYRRGFAKRLTAAAGAPLDATLSPVHGLPALRHGTALKVLHAASHTFLANLLGCPAGVAPVGTISAEDEAAEIEKRNPARTQLQGAARQNAEGSRGLPVAVEVMAPLDHDHRVLDLLEELERRLPTARG